MAKKQYIDTMEAFEIEAELATGNVALYVMPLMHHKHNLNAFSLVSNGVEVGAIYEDEDSIWECLELTPWDSEDIQIIGYQIEQYFGKAAEPNE